jgi:hypothetical protein
LVKLRLNEIFFLLLIKNQMKKIVLVLLAIITISCSNNDDYNDLACREFNTKYARLYELSSTDQQTSLLRIQEAEDRPEGCPNDIFVEFSAECIEFQEKWEAIWKAWKDDGSDGNIGRALAIEEATEKAELGCY